MKKNSKHARFKRSLDRLIASAPDPEVKQRLIQVRDRMKMPMTFVIEKIPGENISVKAATVGVSRQAFYAWVRGVSRPNTIQAKKLEKLTGISANVIRGHTRLAAAIAASTPLSA